MSFPNDEQNQVINHTGKPLVVVAAPGTGKTSTIVARMIKLLKENPNREVSFITFTRTSRRDTDKKVKSEVGREAFEDANFEFPRISTLHTYAKSIVHKYAQEIDRQNTFSILINDKNENKLLLSELCNDLSIEIDIDRLYKDLVCYRCADYFPSDSPVPADQRKEILEHYDFLLKFYNTFDMEGIVQSACVILSKAGVDFPKVFLQVDEYQDLNPKDQELIKLISSTTGSQTVVVGDDAQSIYGFRYAHFAGIREIWASKEWEHIRFPKSHRLPANILRASQSLISGENYLGGEVDIPEDNGERINTFQCTTSDLQIDVVACLIDNIKSNKLNRKGQPLTYTDFMVLCPTSSFVNKVAETLENGFGIPTKKKEKTTIPNDCWRLLLLLRMLHSNDSLALRQWLNIMGLDAGKIEGMRKEAMRLDQSLFDYCSGLSERNFEELFSKLKELDECVGDLEEFRAKLLAFPNLQIEESIFDEVGITINEVTKKPNTLGSIIKCIHEKFGLIDSETEVSEDISEDDRVPVTTLYSAKGLEAEFVFIMWLNDNFFPAPNREVKEELRVLYVGVTRAKQDVIFTFYERYDKKKRKRIKAISPFLQKIVHCINVTRLMKSDYKELLSGLYCS
ncbi:MAG: hypothetical protein A2Y00_05620 [Omnitrophica WOR_2 bacterium GWF2_43_52]|nr:MAG: hypothetical protein A2Y01_07485 [Omnitrophica WOR_2 bacterium GWC2_44_8]OGX20579.1 MAG: hypothetical protein A2Y00_05620 [Omnitrophica WOR_2 bacterium GWF2_43_52]OGX58908.1 MAG: hypothetical protein A2460_03575 [Omnitrophica WOR_2 bacterium RIFOXYC2_FULL_43_9]HAH21603.1 hypothetical protein [Candidatus Omnitrophota bacterium]HBG64197.1 hypothetical protein [Candidatus Omnitrophota bacterium]